MDKLVQSAGTVTNDATKHFDYQKLVEEEIQEYSNIEVTEDLKEGGTHAFKCWEKWFQYISRNGLGSGLHQEVVAYANRLPHSSILSLGCGYGGQEIEIARQLKGSYKIIAVDINDGLFPEGKKIAEAENLHIEFKAIDLNFADISPNCFDIVYAHASLHHIINLEHLLDNIHGCLKDDGVFIILDIIGKSQVLFWKENVDFTRDVVGRHFYRELVTKRLREEELEGRGVKGFAAKQAMRLFPRWCFDSFPDYFLDRVIPKYSDPAQQVGMEGARQEEIQPEILKRFVRVNEFKYGSFMRLICTNPFLGKMLDDDPETYDEKLLRLCELDVKMVAESVLKPTELYGVYRKLGS